MEAAAGPKAKPQHDTRYISRDGREATPWSKGRGPHQTLQDNAAHQCCGSGMSQVRHAVQSQEPGAGWQLHQQSCDTRTPAAAQPLTAAAVLAPDLNPAHTPTRSAGWASRTALLARSCLLLQLLLLGLLLQAVHYAVYLQIFSKGFSTQGSGCGIFASAGASAALLVLPDQLTIFVRQIGP